MEMDRGGDQEEGTVDQLPITLPREKSLAVGLVQTSLDLEIQEDLTLRPPSNPRVRAGAGAELRMVAGRDLPVANSSTNHTISLPLTLVWNQVQGFLKISLRPEKTQSPMLTVTLTLVAWKDSNFFKTTESSSPVLYRKTDPSLHQFHQIFTRNLDNSTPRIRIVVRGEIPLLEKTTDTKEAGKAQDKATPLPIQTIKRTKRLLLKAKPAREPGE